jgi:MFS family permease
VILACRFSLGNEAFDAWGWRIPFIVSIVLLGVSVWIRMQLHESPLFQQMKAEGKHVETPLRDSFKGGNQARAAGAVRRLLGRGRGLVRASSTRCSS